MRLFLRIFLSFWLTTILVIAVVLSVSEALPFTFLREREGRFQPELVASNLQRAINVYERHGKAAFLGEVHDQTTIKHKHVYLFDQYGNLLVDGGNPGPVYAEMAADVLQTGQPELLRFGFRMQFACPLQSETGHRYAAVMSVLQPPSRIVNPRFWFNLLVAMLPTAIVCTLLALYLTRPISQLRATAQRLAAGDLSARASPRIFRRGELGDLARDFDAMASQIELLMTAQRRFVADVSHELGAPLTRMHLALALLRRHLAGKKYGELDRIERETDKLSNLVQQLLLLAGLEASARPVETQVPISICSLCESVIEDANFEAGYNNCKVVGSREDITFLAYPNLLRRAVDNILRNAIRYAPEGTEVRLDCKVDLISQQVILEVHDCGPGVPESMLTAIFRPFFRTASGRESNSGGTGLGLAIASEAVRLHDGTIIAENRKGGGLQVTISLPLRMSMSKQELQFTVLDA
jgi:two-component system, OmpR family, sensor histidine kinase CpxA